MSTSPAKREFGVVRKLLRRLPMGRHPVARSRQEWPAQLHQQQKGSPPDDVDGHSGNDRRRAYCVQVPVLDSEDRFHGVGSFIGNSIAVSSMDH
jgi:hypothetical protein